MLRASYTGKETEIAPVVPEEAAGVSVTLLEEQVEQSVADLFDQIVRQFPDQVAIQCADRVVTFAELDRMANRIAHTLLKRQIPQSLPVGILLGNAVEQIAAMLGVLKAGKFFVLLDPEFPEARILAIVRDSGLRSVISDTPRLNVAKGAPIDDVQLIEYGSIDDSVAAYRPEVTISPRELAYLTYTSGSTGEPKGVIQTQRNLIHRVMLHARVCKVDSRDRAALLHFRTSNAITNSFYGLLNGATLCVFDVKKMGVPLLTNWLARERITICFLSGSLFRSLCRTLSDSGNFPDLRFLRLGSESAYRSDVELFRKHFSSDCKLVNSLSSSETGTICHYVVTQDKEIAGNELPVGYAAKDKEILLLDDQGRELGPNQVGEIVVRSRYLSPGYWQRPELTAAKFKPDPIDPETRLYYAGDLGLMLPDGCLIHKGRKDFRTKIRGYGVDLIEVEKALLSHGRVREAVAISRTVENEARLVAYYTTHTEPAPTVSELREFLLKILPDYMIPSTFVNLDALPLTPGGKIDRRALPEPKLARSVLAEPYVEPRMMIERRLASIWTELLSVDRVGLHDNFFDLGGHSLLGARLVGLIKSEFHVDLPVSELFAAPTIAALAQRIEAGESGKLPTENRPWTYLCELQRGTDHKRKPVFVFPGGGGGEPEFFVYGFLARHVGTDYTFYGLRARGADGIAEPHTSVAQMADAYVEEIRAIQPEGPYYLVGECAGGVNAYEAARRLSAQGQKVAALVLMDVERPTPSKYLRFRASRRLRPAKEFLKEFWNEYRPKNYYILRIPYHLKKLSSLRWIQYPGYLLGRLRNGLKPPVKKPPVSQGSRHEKAAIVLKAAASGEVLRRIERVRENYRRVVRRFRPEPYDGHIELLVSEKLYRRDPTLGWKTLALQGLSIHPLAGDHWSYIRDHAAVAGPKLMECLERAEENRRSRSRTPNDPAMS